MFKLCVLARWDFNFCVRSSPLRGYCEAGQELQKSGEINQEEDEKAAKEEWIEEQCKNIEKEMMSGNNRGAHNTLKALTKSQQLKSAAIEDSSGNIIVVDEEASGRCTSRSRTQSFPVSWYLSSSSSAT